MTAPRIDNLQYANWSPKIFRIVSELVIANENHPGLCIAILARRDSVEMMEELEARVRDFRGTRVVANAGGVNPLACREALFEVARRHGDVLTVAGHQEHPVIPEGIAHRRTGFIIRLRIW